MHSSVFLYLHLLPLLPALAIRTGPHQLRDLYAYPKYQIQFLNDLPVSASDAKRIKEGGIGSEIEWLDMRPGDKSLEDGTKRERLELMPMSFAAKSHEEHRSPYEYLCLMPSNNSTASQMARIDQLEEVEDELDPDQGWKALSHLDGKCLYSKQGWFTYAYCHDSYIRQFRAAAHPHPHPTQGYVPQEDPKYEGYTLGRPHPVPKSKGSRAKAKGGKPGSPAKAEDRSTAVETTGSAPNTRSSPAVSFGLGASSRYLVQRWSDGTKCDKTGRPREIEVQVHCSMTSGDMIYMIKEVAICQYVIIIHSPHLCGLPGFKAHDAEVEPANVMCRQVVDDEEWAKWETEVTDGTDGGGEPRPQEIEEGKETRRSGQLPFSDWPHKEKLQSGFGLAAARERPAGDAVSHEQSRIGETEDKASESIPTDIIFGLNMDEDMKRMLKRAVRLLAKEARGEKRDNDGEEETEGDEVVLISWDEDENGRPVLLEADILLKDEDGEVQLEMGAGEKDMLEKVLRNYMLKANDEEEETRKRVVDEL
ncbi:protein OS-9 [Cryptococcus deuterogattii MMRL2647]|nr:protein OS-9 [Cryptococcus deuterogattii MMRL2647]